MNSLLGLDLPLNNYTLPKYQRDIFHLDAEGLLAHYNDVCWAHHNELALLIHY